MLLGRAALTILLAIFAARATVADQRRYAPSAEQIITEVVKRSEQQQSYLRAYSVTRRYTVRNRRLNGNASMIVLVTYRQGRGKQFSILRTEGTSGVARRALMSLMKEEEIASKSGFPWNEINPSNYRFMLAGIDVRDGQRCYRVKLIPRQKSKLLVEGDLWVNIENLAVVCLEGRLAKSPSFWVSRPYVEQHFQKVHGFWMPSYNRSTAQVRLAGETELIINYWNYRFD